MIVGLIILGCALALIIAGCTIERICAYFIGRRASREARRKIECEREYREWSNKRRIVYLDTRLDGDLSGFVAWAEDYLKQEREAKS